MKSTTQPGVEEGFSRVLMVLIYLVAGTMALIIIAVTCGLLLTQSGTLWVGTKWREVLLGLAVGTAYFGYFNFDALRSDSGVYSGCSPIHKKLLCMWGLLSAFLAWIIGGLFFLAVAGGYAPPFNPFERGFMGALLVSALGTATIFALPVLVLVPLLRVAIWVANGFGAGLNEADIGRCGVTVWAKRVRGSRGNIAREFQGCMRASLIGVAIFIVLAAIFVYAVKA